MKTEKLKNYESIAIIPARGGSKGIPLKNIQPVAGKPLIAHMIEAARMARLVQRVVVTTDHPKIAAVAEQYGAEVVNRPAELSADLSSSETALIHTLDCLKKAEGYSPDLCVFLQCTAPLTLSQDIDGTIETLIQEKADTALAVVPFHYFLWRSDQNGNAVGINHDKNIRLLRQQREDQYLESGAIYVMKTKGFLHFKHRFFGKTAMYVMPPKRCLEMDEPVDLDIARVLLRQQQICQTLSLLPKKIEAVFFDFDGVFTNNAVVVHQDRNEAVICNRVDGVGISELKKLDVPLVLLSTEKNPVVAARCRKLGLECHQNLTDKVSFLNSWLKEHDISQENVIYLGNDVNDAECLKAVGCSVVTGDAHEDVKPLARIILKQPGGYGAVCELSDLILKKLEVNQNGKSS